MPPTLNKKGFWYVNRKKEPTCMNTMMLTQSTEKNISSAYAISKVMTDTRIIHRSLAFLIIHWLQSLLLSYGSDSWHDKSALPSNLLYIDSHLLIAKSKGWLSCEPVEEQRYLHVFPNKVLNITCTVFTDDFIHFSSFWCLSCDRCHLLQCKCLINTYTHTHTRSPHSSISKEGDVWDSLVSQFFRVGHTIHP